jgi:hypothetical protein
MCSGASETGRPSPPPDPADEILAYLHAHPTAADSLEGIVSWWLPRQRYEEARSRIQACLDRLVERGLVSRTRLADGTVLYSKQHPGDAA